MIKMVRIPRILLDHENYKKLSDRAKVLYGILWEKKQEAASHGWVDDRGILYVVLPKRKMQEALSCSRYRLDLVTRELVATDLIELAYGVGNSLERRIYVHGFTEECPWIRVEYGLRQELKKEKKTPPDIDDPVNMEKPGGEKVSDKEKTGSLGSDPKQDGSDDSCKVSDPAELLKIFLESGKDIPPCEGTGLPEILDALASAIL